MPRAAAFEAIEDRFWGRQWFTPSHTNLQFAICATKPYCIMQG
jgi:hypothetical protein